MSDNVISINRPLLNKLNEMLAKMGKPKITKANAVLVDSKGFMQQMQVEFPWMPMIEIAVPEPISFRVKVAKFSEIAAVKRMAFMFYQDVDGTAIYKEHL